MNKLTLVVTGILLFWLTTTAFGSDVSVYYNTTGAIVNADKTLTFDDLYNTSASLSGYTSNGIVVDTSGAFHCCDFVLEGGSGGVYYPAGGSWNNTVISRADSGSIYGLQMNLGDGWAESQNHHFWFEVLDGTTVLDSGTFSVDTLQPYIFGVRDDAGFTSMHLVGSGGSSVGPTSFNAVALDKLVVDVTAPNSPVPEPSSLALLGTGLLGAVGAIRRRLNK